MKHYTILLAILLLSSIAKAEPRFSACFGDHAVLQSGNTTTVWGFDAAPGHAYFLKFGQIETKVEVHGDGTWHAILPNLKRSSKEDNLELWDAQKVIATAQGVVVGEVWLAAGQSNMQMQVRSMVKDMAPAKEWGASASFPNIRFRRVNDPVLSGRDAEASDLATYEPWEKMSPESVGNFTATAAVFAREIAETLNCPVGIIDVSWGGKPIEPFIPREAFKTPFLTKIKSLADAEKLDELQRLRGGVIIRNTEGYPGAIFNARMAPLTPFSIAGFLWYQAESNAGRGEDPREYRHKMAALASGWRARWDDESLPLNFVQLPSFSDATGWIRVREEQRRALEIPNTAMAVTIDIRGEGIHPPDKLEVGKRLAKHALRNTYGKKEITASGPLYSSHSVSKNEVTIQFTETGKGLISGNRPVFSAVEFDERGELKWFEVAGEDGKWHTASARIEKDTVVVSSEAEPNPVAVRYGCRTSPQGGNLYNRAGLPASPFCSNLKMLGWQDQPPGKVTDTLKATYDIDAPPEECLQAWLDPKKLNRWLSTSATLKDGDLILTSRLPIIGGRHRIAEQTKERLAFDWYIDGFETSLELDFKATNDGTALTLTHTSPGGRPDGLAFPPGNYYGDEVWKFAMSNFEHFIAKGGRVVEMPWPHNPHQIDLRIEIEANPERIWKHLTTVEKLKRASLVDDTAKIEPHAGGRYSFGWTKMESEKRDGPGFIAEWAENKKLKVSWYGGRDSTVSWELTEGNDNTTEVSFTHTGLAFTPDVTLSYQFGWAEFLIELKGFVEEKKSAQP
jgi:sialate O-acetylesterase